MIRRLMFHYHLVTRNDQELIKKVYLKQKESSIKGDWFRTLQDDFQFIGEEIDDEKIVRYSKCQYKTYITEKVKKAAFQSYLALKEKSKKKFEWLEYTSLKIQPYMTDDKFSLKQIQLLHSLRSKCYPAKANFKKFNRGDLKCTFQCNEEETQHHIFEACQPIKQQLNIVTSIKLDSIYGNLSEQLEVMCALEKIDDTRTLMKKDIQLGVGTHGCAMGRLAS